MAEFIPDPLPPAASHARDAGVEEVWERSNLTQNQLLVWLAEKFQPNLPLHNIAVTFTIAAAVDRARFQQAFQALIDHCDALRTVIEEVDGLPQQRVRPHLRYEMGYIDFSTLPDPSAATRQWVRERAQSLFQLDGRLFDSALLKLSDQTFVWFLSHHHLITDAWSVALIYRYQRELYARARQGRLDEPFVLPRFADFVAYERAQRHTPQYEKARAYWERKLADGPDPILFYGRPAARRGTRVVRVPRDLGIERSRRLKALAAREEFAAANIHVSLFRIFVTAFLAYLHRISGRPHIALGTPFLNRPSKAFKDTVGLFMQVSPLHFTIEAGETFASLSRNVKAEMFEVLRHQRYTTANSPQHRVYDVVFNYNHSAGPDFHGAPMQVESIYPGHETNSLALQVHDYDIRGNFVVDFDFHGDVFAEPEQQQTIQHVLRVLDAVCVDPRQRLSGIDLLSAVETQHVLGDLNGAAMALPPGETLVSLLDAQAHATPEALAVAHAEDHLTYRQLRHRANQVAHHLQALGVGPDVVVGLCLERSPDMLIGLLGILKAGGAYLPLDPTSPPPRLAFMLAEARVRVLLTQHRLLATLPRHAARVLCLDADRELIAQESVEDPVSQVGDDNLAYVIYTSGSTGYPKGVLVTRRGLLNYTRAAADLFGLGPEDRVLQFASLSFDTAAEEILPALARGAQLVLRTEAMLDSLPGFLEACEDWHITVLDLPTSFWHELTSAVATGTLRVPPLLRLVIIGGERARPERLHDWQRHVPRRVRLLNTYGPTEATVVATSWEASTMAQPEVEGDVPIGTPIPNVRVYLLDRYLTLVPPGIDGELHIAGAGLARGYLDRPELTAQQFIPNPFGPDPGARMYRTGDRARWRPDGRLEFLGRLDHQVKVRGFRIELGEIEAVLCDHPAVQHAVVVAGEDDLAQTRLAAYLVCAAAPPPTAGDLRRYLQATLPDYMIPSAFVLLDALPLLPSGKVDHRALPAPHAHPAERPAWAPPRTPLEEELAHIWSAVLGVEPVGIHDNFFELGGDSILSLQVVARASQAGLRLTPRHLFERPTIAELAPMVVIGHALRAEQGVVTGPAPLTPIQRWFFEQQGGEPHHFNQAVLLEVRRPLDAGHLKAAIERLLVHHDALRLRFSRDEEGWRQTVAAPDDGAGESVFERIELSGLPEGEQRAALETQAARLQGSLDLSSGPLLKVALFTMGHGPDRLLVVIHHLAVDGVSWRVLLEDLFTACGQLGRGLPVQLAPKSTSFKQWSERLQTLARADSWQPEARYWRDLIGQPSALLPVDHESGTNDVTSAESVVTSLNAAETRSLLHEVPAAYRTQINDALLAALVQAFQQWTGRAELCLELEGHGREELFEDVDLSRTVGWFTSLVPVRLALRGRPGPGEALKSIKEQLRAIPQRGIGYGLLRYLHPDAELRQELARWQAEVGFNYLGQLDQALTDPALALAKESSGPSQSPRGRRVHLLDVNGAISDGCLQLVWTYSRHRHERATIERLAAAFIDSLRALIAHCQSDEAGGYTPSDFPLARLDQLTLDRLVGKDRNVEDVYPLSHLQSGLLFHSLYASESSLYFEQVSCTLEGALDVAAFRRAWQRAVDRHAVLRTGFVWQGLKEPIQVVHREVPLPWTEEDWRGLTVTEQGERLDAFLREDRRRRFDLAEPPLMRMALLQAAEQTWHFVWSHHHLLLDGWSLPLLFKELMISYEGGAEITLDRPRPYREFIAWLARQDLQPVEAFWRDTLRGFTAATPLAMERPAGRSLPSPDAGYAEELLRLAAEATSALEQLARGEQLTLNTIVQGAWALLLSRYSGRDDVLFGATVSGRSAPLPGIETMIGLFINAVPVRARIRPDAEALAWLHQLQERQVELLQYEHSPLVAVQGWSDVPPGHALFDSLLVFENYPIDRSLRQYTGSVRIGNVRHPEFTNYPLSIVVSPGPELSLRVSYECRRFEAAAVRRMLGHVQTLLEALAGNPRQRVAGLPLLTAAERRQLSQWNDTRVVPTDERWVHQLFEGQMERTPDGAAVLFEDETLTYRQLELRANQLAHALHDLGVRPDTVVAVHMERSAALVVALVGILKAGGAYLPIDPEYPRARRELMLADARPLVVLTDRATAAELPAVAAPVLTVEDGHDPLASQPTARPAAAIAGQNLAYVIYTSGSTGRPKAAMNTHAGLLNRLLWMQAAYPLTPADRVLQKTPFSFDVSVWEFFWPLMTGATLVMARPGGHRDSRYLLDIIVNRRVTTVHFVPSMLRVFLEEQDHLACDSLRQVICSGEALPFDLQRRFFERSGAELHNLYGPTEAAIDVTAWRCRREGEPVVPIGRPIWNTRIFVLDAELRQMPVGVPGELYLGGVGLGRGYLDRPDLTAERFVPDPLGDEPGTRLYRTGDLARYLPDGNVEFLGRLDDQVKIRGFRIELGEIEAILHQHPAVQAAVVQAREERLGQQRLVAYIVPDARARDNGLGPAGLIAELRRSTGDQLPEYMVPAVFVLLPSLPLSPNGKVDRRALPAPESTRPELLKQYVAPRTPAEQLLAGIWSEVLQIDRVGVHDNFFELGGHSLLATQVVSRVRRSLEVELPLREIFAAPTVARLAQTIQQTGPGRQTPAIRPVGRDRELPLSFGQERLWFLDQLVPGHAFYNMPAAVRAKGLLDVAVLERSVNEVVRRHEALRTTFATTEGRPFQVVAQALRVELPVIDLGGLADAQRETEIRRLAGVEAGRPFDLGQGPLVRVMLLRLDDQDHVLLLTLHHIVADGWSMGVCVRELAVLYTAFMAGAPSPLPELPIQYADFAHWQRQWFQGGVLEQQLSYWRTQLAELPVLHVPTDRPRPAVQTFRGATEAFTLPGPLSESLVALSRREEVTPFMTLLAAFQTLLARYSGQDDVVVGSPIANRNRAETEGLIGFFVNSLVLRTDLSGAPSFRELLRRVREVCLGAYAHQDLPFEKLVQELHPSRDLGREPLFQVVFGLENTPVETIHVPGGLVLSALPADTQTAKYDLTLFMGQRADGLAGLIEYNTDLFGPDTIRRMLDHFRTLLEGIVADPDAPLPDVPLVEEAERQQVLVGWNRTRREYPRGACIHGEFEAQARRRPDAVALICDDQQLSYGALNARANQLAHFLRRRAIGPGALVGICLDRSFDMVVGLLGILKAGGAYAALDPGYPGERLAFMLEDADVAVVLTRRRLAGSLPSGKAELVCLDGDWEQIAGESAANPISRTTAEDLAYVNYTSGSTGIPKAVAVPHRAVLRLVCGTEYARMDAGQTFLHLSSISFDASTFELWGPLLHGGRCVLFPDLPPTAHELARLLRGDGVTTVWLTASLFNAVVDEAPEALSSVRQLLIGGEALSVAHVRRAQVVLPDTEIINGYGPTESTTFTCCHPVARGIGADAVSIPIGRPIANTQVYLVDARLNPVPVGVPGELCIGGDGLARGYLNCPDLTAERFIPDPFGEDAGRRLYRTGDLARWRSDGAIEFLGRIDHQVKIRGFRVEPGEIEAVLRQHPDVASAVVMAREDSPGIRRLVAYVVGAGAQPLDTESLRAFLKRQLPDYMVPAAVVSLDALPLTASGKVDRRALPSPDHARLEEGATFVPPRTAREEELARIWSAVLGVERIGVSDNFFELGGDSILSIQVVARARAVGLGLTPRQIFQHPTIAELAAVAGRGEPSIAAEQGIVTGDVPLTPIQRWFFDQEPEEPEHFNQALLLAVRQPLDPGRLESVVEHLLAHHDALRMRFARDGHAWRQHSAALEEGAAQNVFALIDLREVPSAEQRETVDRAAAGLQASLDLAAGPVIRVALFQGRDTDRLLLVIHHLVVDGVSWRILLEDLLTGYEQLARGVSIRWPPKTTAFKQWSERLSRYAHADALLAELSHWNELASRADAPLPVDHVGEVNDVASAGTVQVSLDPAETDALLRHVPQAYRTQINDVLLTALMKSFGSWTGRDTLLLDLEGHGREELFEDIDVSRTVGWFTSLFPVRLELRPDLGPGAALSSIKEQLRRVPGRGLGYGLLRYLHPDERIRRRLADGTTAEVSVNYLGQFDQALPETAPVAVAPESPGPLASPRGRRAYLVDVAAGVAGGRLLVTWTFSHARHRRSTVEALAQEFREALRSLIAHCSAPEAGGCTPSDFPLARLTQTALDRLAGTGREIEDIYPLSHLQSGLLFHSLYAPETGAYFEQLWCIVEGALDVGAFRQAWQRVVDRHAVLRTYFVWEGLAAPVQVVRRQASLPWDEQDWRELSAAEHGRRLESYLAADRARGFSLGQAPLMRLALLRLADHAWHFVWSHHHLLLDGWSLPLLMKEVLLSYEGLVRGQEIPLEPPRPYREFIAWLGMQDLQPVEAFWRKALGGFQAPTPLLVERDAGDEPERYAGQQILLSPETTSALARLAQERQVTLNTVVLGAWALLLSRHSGQEDIVLGTTVSGRSAPLPGIESMLGLFINALPVRVRVRPSDHVRSWLRSLHEQLAELLPYEWSPLAQVQAWSDVPRGLPLFESLFVFENYPVDRSLERGSAMVQIRDVNLLERSNYPLVLVVVPGTDLLLRMGYECHRFAAATVARALEDLCTMLEAMAAAPEARLSDVAPAAGRPLAADAPLSRVDEMSEEEVDALLRELTASDEAGQ